MSKQFIRYGIVILIFMANLAANPVMDKQIRISEFLIQNDSTWVIEVEFYSMSDDPIDTSEYHTMIIGSSFGERQVKYEVLRDSLHYLLLTPDSLTEPLKINAQGDSVYLRTYDVYGNPSYLSHFRFGPGKYSQVTAPEPNQSIRLIPEDFAFEYCLDNSPTLGFENDTTGIWATVKGRVWDKDSNRVANADLNLFGYDFKSDSLGNFELRLYARKYLSFYLYLRKRNTEDFHIYPMDTFAVNLTPDTVVHTDIHLTTYTGIKTLAPKLPRTVEVIAYPNPFNPGTYFHVTPVSESPVKRMKLEIFDIRGQMIRKFSFSTLKHSIYWNGRDALGKVQPSGKYFYRLSINGKMLNSGSVILVK